VTVRAGCCEPLEEHAAEHATTPERADRGLDRHGSRHPLWDGRDDLISVLPQGEVYTQLVGTEEFAEESVECGLTGHLHRRIYRNGGADRVGSIAGRGGG
jgi:hypothetical protein